MMLSVMGVDPGFAAMGVAVVSQAGRLSPPELRSLEIFRTQKEAGKGRRDLRVSADDTHRARAMYDGLKKTIDAQSLNAVAYEVYQPFRAQGGSAWKVARIEGVIMTAAWSEGIMVLPYLPFDLKTRIAGKRSASKDEVQVHVLRRLPGAREALGAIPMSLREHAADALGYALIGLEEAWEVRGLVVGSRG